MRLRNKLNLILFLLSLVVIASTVLVLYLSEKRHLTRQLEEQQWSSLNKFGRVAAESIIDDNEILRMGYVKTFMESSAPGAVAYIALLDAKGRLLMHDDFLRGDYSKARTQPQDPALVAATQNLDALRQTTMSQGRRLSLFSVPVTTREGRLG
ncbi:MAG: hypothetical protein AAB425_11495, partial [Bdellovibrionota bacterium]